MRCRVALIVALASSACGWKTRSQHQRDYVNEELMPHVAADSAEAPLRPVRSKLRLEILADARYRALPEWHNEIATQVQQASDLLFRQVGVELDVARIGDWDRPKGSDDIERALRELEAEVPARDVDLVIGLITPLPLVTSAIHSLGVTRLMGRHIVLRGMDDVSEMMALREHFDALGDTERFEIYRARKRHKQGIVLAHEVAHTMGLIHVKDGDLVMSTSWSPEQTGFAPEEVKIFHLGLAFHVRRLREAQAHGPIEDEWRAARTERLRTSAWPAWDPGEREQLLAGEPVAPMKPAPSPVSAPPSRSAPASGSVVPPPPLPMPLRRPPAPPRSSAIPLRWTPATSTRCSAPPWARRWKRSER